MDPTKRNGCSGKREAACPPCEAKDRRSPVSGSPGRRRSAHALDRRPGGAGRGGVRTAGRRQSVRVTGLRAAGTHACRHEARHRCPSPGTLQNGTGRTTPVPSDASPRWFAMIYPPLPLPLPPDDGDRLSLGHGSPDIGGGTDSRLYSRRRGRTSSPLPLHLEEAFLISHCGRRPREGVVRFRIPDLAEERRPGRSRSHRADVGRQLAGSTGQLRLVGGRSAARGTAPGPPLPSSRSTASPTSRPWRVSTSPTLSPVPSATNRVMRRPRALTSISSHACGTWPSRNARGARCTWRARSGSCGTGRRSDERLARGRGRSPTRPAHGPWAGRSGFAGRAGSSGRCPRAGAPP